MSELEALAAEFWTWRAAQQPRSRDDIPRIDRPAGWVPDFSADAVALPRFERFTSSAQTQAVASRMASGAVHDNHRSQDG